MGKCFDYTLRIVLFIISGINFIIAVWFLTYRTIMDKEEDRKYIATKQDYLVICGVLFIPFLDFALVRWGQRTRSSGNKACKFVSQMCLAVTVRGSFYISLRHTKNSLDPVHVHQAYLIMAAGYLLVLHLVI